MQNKQHLPKYFYQLPSSMSTHCINIYQNLSRFIISLKSCTKVHRHLILSIFSSELYYIIAWKTQDPNVENFPTTISTYTFLSRQCKECYVKLQITAFLHPWTNANELSHTWTQYTRAIKIHTQTNKLPFICKDLFTSNLDGYRRTEECLECKVLFCKFSSSYKTHNKMSNIKIGIKMRLKKSKKGQWKVMDNNSLQSVHSLYPCSFTFGKFWLNNVEQFLSWIFFHPNFPLKITYSICSHVIVMYTQLWYLQ